MASLRKLLVLACSIGSALSATCVVPGGTTDDAPAIKAALATCNNGGTVVLSGTYTIATFLNTTALNNVAIELTGTINLNPSISYWKASSFQLVYQSAYTSWLIGGQGIHIYGGGSYNGGGDTWYAAGTTGPIPWTIYKAKNVVVENIKMTQAPFWHNFVYQSNNVTFDNINIRAIQSDGTQAQNTDGWDIYRSDNVKITNSYIVNGDDCVSLKPNATNVLIENLYCQGSHGISMGSIGQYAGIQDIIQNVMVKNITMVNTSNGARIKAWGGSSSATSTSGGGNGYVQNVTFQDFKCSGCALPIVIDQCYSTSASVCASYPSKVLINDIHYISVTGTGTKSKEVVSMVCSDICSDITAVGTSLVGSSGSSEYFCTNIASLTSLDFPCSEAGSIVSSSKKTTSTTTTKKTTSTSSTKVTTTTSKAVTTSSSSKVSSTTTKTSSTSSSVKSTTLTTKTSSTSTKVSSTSSSVKSSSSSTNALTSTAKSSTLTTKTSSSSAAASTNTSLAALYGQCGGDPTTYTGPVACVSPYTCVFSTIYYSQCQAV